MRKLLLISLVIVVGISACKKDPVTVDKKDITGEWFYQNYNDQYFDAGSNLMYNDDASPDQILALPHYTFLSDLQGAYGGDNFTYQIKSAGSNDSLIVTGDDYNHRFLIMSISQSQVVLQENVADAEPLQNAGTGEIAYSAYRRWTITLGRSELTR